MAAQSKPETTAVAKREQREKVDQLRQTLARFEPNLAAVLPRYITPDRLITLTLTAASKNPDLFDCTMESVALALMQVAQWGLEINRTAYLVPFGKTCTAIPAWQGLVELMLRGGHVRDVKARAVYANEHFRVMEGAAPALEHEPLLSEKQRGDLAAFYAVAFLAGGRATWEVMTRADVDAIRARARSKNSDAWNNHYVEMGKKTAIRRLAKRMPQTLALQSALSTEERLDAGELAEVIRDQERRYVQGIAPERQRQMIAAPSEPGDYEHETHPAEQPREVTATRVAPPVTDAQRALADQGAGQHDPYDEGAKGSGADGQQASQESQRGTSGGSIGGGARAARQGHAAPASTEPTTSSLATRAQKERITELLSTPGLDLADAEIARIAKVAGAPSYPARDAVREIARLEALLPGGDGLFGDEGGA